MAYTNPFSEVMETFHPLTVHARTLRTSFNHKLYDTYYVIAGSFFYSNEKANHIGLFDYATLMLAYYLWRLLAWCWKQVKVNPLAAILLLPVLAINLPFLALRYITAATITFICLPLLAIIHGLAQIKGTRLKRDALELLVYNLSKKETAPLVTVLEQEEVDLEDLSVEWIGSYQKFSLEFHKDQHKYCMGGGCLIAEPTILSTVEIDLNCLKKNGIGDEFPQPRTDEWKQLKALQAIIELNLGNLSAKLEYDRKTKATLTMLNHIFYCLDTPSAARMNTEMSGERVPEKVNTKTLKLY